MTTTSAGNASPMSSVLRPPHLSGSTLPPPPSSAEGLTMARESTSVAVLDVTPINHAVADPVAPRLLGDITAVTPCFTPRLPTTLLSSGGVTTKPWKLTLGFDVVALVLDKTLYNLMPALSTPKATASLIITACRQLRTSFTSPQNGIKKSPPPLALDVSSPPTLASSTRRAAMCNAPTPSAFASGHSKDATSSTHQGLRRLIIAQIVRLMPGDEFILVIPPVDKQELKLAVPRRKVLLGGFCRIFL